LRDKAVDVLGYLALLLLADLIEEDSDIKSAGFLILCPYEHTLAFNAAILIVFPVP
jgi:hypothetical protein